MKKKINWNRVVFITGVVALVIGTLDPLEGSVLILAGSIMITIASILVHDRYRKIFLASSIMIAVGVALMFYFSSLGGFGDKGMSWWWGIMVLPYPLGWLLLVVTLIIRVVKKGSDGKVME